MKKIIFTLILLSSISSFAQDLFMQSGTVNQCSGIFYDTGGEFGNYGNDENLVLTICPENVGDKLRLNFTDFVTQQGLTPDTMTIFDGDDITAPPFGTFSGPNSPGLVEATAANTSGCLTIEFISNDSGNINGWAADISCITPCQTIVANLDSTVPALEAGNLVIADTNETITFNGSGTFSVDGTGATYFWDFGDGNTAMGQSVTHAYAMGGIYTVTLTVTDANPAVCQSTNDIGLTAQIGASNPGNPFVDAGDDMVIDCADSCTDITAEFLEIGETTTYTVQEIPFVPPFPFQGLTNSVNTNIDDAWDAPQNLPIDFCFFGNIEPQFQVGSNGVIRFDVDPNDTSNAFNLQNDPLPNNTNDALGEGNVFSPVHDIDPAASTGEEIAWEIIGTAPNRVLAVSFFNVEMYGCDNTSATHMAVFYETTNVIDIYIQNAPFCNRWNNNKAVGIQNHAGNQAFVPPGRNTNENGGWTTQEEAWRFTPAGPSIIDFAWLDSSGAVIGTTPTLNVCPASDSETYTAQVTYTSCNGDTVVVTDNVTVTRDIPFTVDLGGDIDACVSDADITLDADISSTTATYQWFQDGLLITGETDPTLTVPSPNSGIYTATVTDQSCSLSDDVAITFFESPIVNTVSQYQSCDDATIDGFTEFDLSTKVPEILGGQTDVDLSFHDSQEDADDNVDTLPNLFTNTVNPQTIFVRLENTNNTDCYSVATFELLVASSITLDMPDNLVLCDDLGQDGEEEFDFTNQTTDILIGINDATLSYHENMADAENDTAALPNNYTNTSNPQTIYVRVEDNSNPLCYAITSFELIINPLPGIVPVTPLAVCDDDTDGFAMFDMSTKEAEILDGQAGVLVSFHESFAGAETDTGELADGYTNMTANNQTLFVRLENTATGCYNITTLGLVVQQNPIVTDPTTPLEVCDDDNDGFVLFDLSQRDAEVAGGQAGMAVSYYDTPVEAEAGNNPLPTNYTNITADAQEIYARLENAATGCYDTVPLQLVVNPLPATVAVSPYELCDYTNTGDEQEQFDLTTKDAEILDGQVNVTVTYYGNQADADATINAITAPYTNTINPQPIVAVLTNTNTGCRDSVNFDLVVNPLPSLVAPIPLEVCDDGTPDGLTDIDLTIKNTEISANNPAYSVSYYLTQTDAESGTDPLAIPYTNISNPQTVFVRVEDVNTGCYDTTTLELVVEQAPVAFTPEPLRYCDPDNDGLGIFTLTDAETEITGGAGGLDVTYHETMANAENGVDAIDTTVSYSNIVTNIQTLYVRVESNTIATDCATIVELQLIVEPTPQLIAPTPLEVCDDISADGFAQFDLTTKNEEILNGQDPAQYVVSYYETEAFADVPSNAIANPTAYTNTDDFNQTIWVRVDDNTTVAGCYKLTTLELIVNPLPVLVTPPPLELCDVNNPGDEQEAFTLEDANDAILNGQTGITLSYYESQADADTGTDPIVSPYTNTSNAQTVYVRAVNDATGCVNTVTVTLRVDPIPSPEDEPTEIRVCDDDNDGFAEFDLEVRTVEITNGEPDVVITYHETESDADTGENPLTSPYTNIVSGSQMIYVRSENTLTGCYSLTDSELQLVVDPAPEVPAAIDDYVICDDDNNGFAQFDLTTKDEEIYIGQNDMEFTLTYHLSAADAATGNNPIINTGNYTNATNPQIIYVRMLSNVNGCEDTGEFEIRVELPPEAVQPTPLEECDDLGERPGDETTVFDLTVKNDEITGGNASWSVNYYETNADAQAQENAIPDPTQYTNMTVNGLPSNPQTLYIVVTDTDTGCVDFTTMTIRVLPNPTPTLSEDIPDLELCDDINTGDGVEEFNLLGLNGTNAQEDLILNGEQGVTATYYETQEDASSGTNAIVDPTQYTNIGTPTQEIYVRVSNDVTGCYELVDFTIRVNPLPEVVAVTDFIQCEVNTDGIDSFDLTTKDGEVLNGQDPLQFTVTYHDNLADAEAQINALVSNYTNTSNPQQIFVAITNNATGCSIATQSFNLEVQEGAEANADMNPIVYEECDDNMETDGDPSNDSVQFDLSTQDMEILDGQDPADYQVTYYETEADANLNVNPLPTLYENITNPQVIYARVDNDIQNLLPIALDLAALGTALDLDGNGTNDTYDTDNDGVFDLVDIDGDGNSDVVGTNVDGTIAFVDVDGDGQGDPVDLDNDGTFDNQQDSSICFAVAELTLQVNPLPLFELEESYTLCLGTNGTEILEPLVIDTGLSEADYDFEWSYDGTVLPGETGGSLVPTQEGTYRVIVTDLVTGCVNDLDVGITEVQESGPPSVEANVLTQAFADNHVIEAVATGQGVYEYSLDGGPWQDSGVFNNVSSGEHEITARDRNGCGTATTTVTVFDYPLYFTPNGDGNHDTWQIENIGNSAKIYIFDRYGKLLKQIGPSGNGWDGTYNGSAMPTSDYWFTIEYDEPSTGQRKEFRAHFTLKR